MADTPVSLLLHPAPHLVPGFRVARSEHCLLSRNMHHAVKEIETSLDGNQSRLSQKMAICSEELHGYHVQQQCQLVCLFPTTSTPFQRLHKRQAPPASRLCISITACIGAASSLHLAAGGTSGCEIVNSRFILSCADCHSGCWLFHLQTVSTHHPEPNEHGICCLLKPSKS